ncbi:hypothetical protein MMC17_006489 [Xylographa soralifera]|nr:hypothetical protein [Xylographa soralifera]
MHSFTPFLLSAALLLLHLTTALPTTQQPLLLTDRLPAPAPITLHPLTICPLPYPLRLPRSNCTCLSEQSVSYAVRPQLLQLTAGVQCATGGGGSLEWNPYWLVDKAEGCRLLRGMETSIMGEGGVTYMSEYGFACPGDGAVRRNRTICEMFEVGGGE